MQKSRNTLLVTAALAAIGIATAFLFYGGLRRGNTAQASPAGELLSEVPAGAPTLIYIDLAAVRASTFYQHSPDRGPITLPDRDYADFVRSTGFDFEKDLDRVVIASWPSSLGQDQKKTVVVADGRFDRGKIRDYAMRKGKLDHQEGREVFLFPADDRKRWNAVSFLDDHRIAIVEGSSIAPLLARHGNDPTADPARERAARVAGAAVFAISRVPAIPENFAPGGVQSSQLANLARSVQWITLAARPEGENLRVSLEGECTTATDARQVQSALEILRLFGRAGLENPKTRQSMDPATYGVLETLLKTAEVTQTAEQVRILVEITPDILKTFSGPRVAQ
jgi:hypothetical protein